MEAEQPIFTGRQLRALIVPLVLEQILGLTVGMADSIMVSSAGKAAVSIFSMWTFRIGCSYLFTLVFQMGLIGIWAAMAVDWIFRSSCFVWRFHGQKWLKKGKNLVN